MAEEEALSEVKETGPSEEERRRPEHEGAASGGSKKAKQKKAAIYAGLGIIGVVLLVLAYRYYENHIAGGASATPESTGTGDNGGGASGGGGGPATPTPTPVDYGPDFAALEAELAALENRAPSITDVYVIQGKTPSKQVPTTVTGQTVKAATTQLVGQLKATPKGVSAGANPSGVGVEYGGGAALPAGVAHSAATIPHTVVPKTGAAAPVTGTKISAGHTIIQPNEPGGGTVTKNKNTPAPKAPKVSSGHNVKRPEA